MITVRARKDCEKGIQNKGGKKEGQGERKKEGRSVVFGFRWKKGKEGVEAVRFCNGNDVLEEREAMESRWKRGTLLEGHLFHATASGELFIKVSADWKWIGGHLLILGEGATPDFGYFQV